jgi:two-component sensor histidine kinase
MINFFKVILLFFFVSVSTHSFSQNINYSLKNFSLKDGLAGDNVYCATQDEEGFIWFGTETGLSRFDGSHFKNYTVADGLPDNEIINIFTDSKGRIWLVPFKKSLCYIYKRKIYNSSNDSTLRNVKILGSCNNIVEDNNKNVIIHDTKAIHILDINGIIKTVFADSIGKDLKFEDIQKSSSGKIYIVEKRGIFELADKKLKQIFILPKNYRPFTVNRNFVNDSIIFVPNSFDNNISRFTVVEFQLKSKDIKVYPIPKLPLTIELKNNKIYSTSNSGVDIFDAKSKNLDLNIDIKEPVNRTFLDEEGNMYLLTRNSGIFIKKNANIQYQDINNNGTRNLAIDYLNGNKNSLFVGASNYNPVVIDKNDMSKVKYLANLAFEGGYGKSASIICYMDQIEGGKIQVASIEGVSVANKKYWNYLRSDIVIKQVIDKGDNYLISTNVMLLLAKKPDFKILDTLWNERTTAANFIDNNYYIGTINGLYKLTTNKVSTYLGDSFPIFKRRISSIKKGFDNTIWVATYDAGIAAYKNGKVLQLFNDSNGLTSNICRNLFVNGNYLWVGTDKGLNKIDISKPPYKIIINYTTTDGLASNMINAVYTDSNMVYVGTPEGLTFFDETKIVNNSKCNMRILGITISGKEQQWDSSKIILKNKDNNIRFDFVALSFRSAGDIIYTYRLVGLDDKWKTTRENYLDYPSLPSGNYTLEIYGTNKFGVKSSIVKVDIEIEKKLIEKIWFRLLLLMLSLGLIYFYFSKRINKIRQKAEEKEQIADKLNEMEQMALKAQMNPHFIFNCLNSIQEYVINTDVKGANKFISAFAKLIRSTLDNSSKKTITVADEINYLNTYLTLEQNRFENKFDFNIYTSDDIKPNDTYIPPMLLQPYIENAIRHGINNKKEGQGLIQINIIKVYNNFVCEIIDNGIGRAASQKLKGNTKVEYQSKGMDLTAKRIQLLNKDIAQNIVVQIEDLYIPDTGTKVTITIPIN